MSPTTPPLCLTASLFQQTLAKPTAVSGVGYWSGKPITVEFFPAPENSGLTFIRRDLVSEVRIPVTSEFRIEAQRRTTLQAHNVQVEMVEHILSALAGLGIDNCDIYVDACEMPGCDGSSAPYTVALLTAGIVQQKAPTQTLIVKKNIRIGTDQQWIEASPSKAGEFSIDYMLDYGEGSPIEKQTFCETITPSLYASELAPCRTFLLRSEADMLIKAGLGTHVTTKELVIYNDDGPDSSNPLRFENECVRHKVLDAIGDFALVGCKLQAHIRAYRTGHLHNGMLAAEILAAHPDQHPTRIQNRQVQRQTG